ncbi:putative KEX1 protein precursor [Kockovaella imperatae]|uniref:Pheromone-processing carboxypeptidase KEX1 n=1 Tax=Kockovaella imperatae TaxID=4999 RepID=A0A1Y1UKE2_9TREE|nr:putative KEX1 protein precursor [Kockovaella imperatae]ORX38007.1 putative KEX1 protein precursor [Kockovaella imperatae]
MESRARVQLSNVYAEDDSQTSRSDEGSSSRAFEARQGNNLPSAADFFVPSLPGLPNLATHPTHPVNLYAGLLPSDPGEAGGGGEGSTGRDAELYFLMVKARRSAGRQRLVLWFNGGPGCSSFDGALMEIGPFRTVPADQTTSGKVELKLVEGGWEEFATVVFIDQPPGTGFSYVPTNGYLHELDQGSQHLITFLKNLYKVFPELKGLDTYLCGESFAGQYIPYFADALIKNPPQGFNMKGIAIGNGWIDPIRQYPAYAHFAYEKGLLKEGSKDAEKLEERLSRCMEEMERYTDPMNTPINIGVCQSVMDAVTEPFTQELNGKRMCMNIYDVRLQDEYPACGMNWPPDLTEVYSFLRSPEVIRSLHAEKKDTAWTECSGRVGAELRLRTSTASVVYLPTILEAGVEVLIFAGADDLICNYKGQEEMIQNMRWKGVDGWGNSTFMDWSMNGTKVGQWVNTRNLTYAKILDSSHMVGFDKPHVTNDMITRFMKVDFSLLPGMLASSSSKIGTKNRLAIGTMSTAAAGIPLLKGGDSEWEAWYNAGSAILILLILLSIVAIYFYFRRKGQLRRRGMMSLSKDDMNGDGDDYDERIPLGSGERVELEDIERAEGYEYTDSPGGERKRRTPRRNGGHSTSGSGGGSSRKGKGKSTRAGHRSVETDSPTSSHGGQTVFALGDEDDEGR